MKNEQLPRSPFITRRPSLQVFAEHMELRLRANDKKSSYQYCSQAYLLMRLKEETKELQSALRKLRLLAYKNDAAAANQVILEAADVANFAMMIASNASSK